MPNRDGTGPRGKSSHWRCKRSESSEQKTTFPGLSLLATGKVLSLLGVAIPTAIHLIRRLKQSPYQITKHRDVPSQVGQGDNGQPIISISPNEESKTESK